MEDGICIIIEATLTKNNFLKRELFTVLVVSNFLSFSIIIIIKVCVSFWSALVAQHGKAVAAFIRPTEEDCKKRRQ